MQATYRKASHDDCLVQRLVFERNTHLECRVWLSLGIHYLTVSIAGLLQGELLDFHAILERWPKIRTGPGSTFLSDTSANQIDGSSDRNGPLYGSHRERSSSRST